MRICFFANMSRHANWREMFDKVEFYRLDIALLRELGHEVVLAGQPQTLDWRADLYYCWWWGHAPAPILLGKLRRKPVIVTGAFDYSTCRNELPGVCYLDRPAWQKALLRWALRNATANLFISQAEFDEVTAALPVHNPICAPLAIDTGVYRPGRSTAPRDHFFTVVWSSRSNAIRKGLPQTIEAFARVASRLPRSRLVIAGKPGDYRDAMIAFASSLGVADQVDFIGMISEAEKLDWYHRCAAYVQPTLYEGFGHAIGEAIASGAHVVTSLRGAVPEVAGSHATCVDPFDIEAIAAAMLASVEQPRTPARAEAAHQWIAEKFSLPVRRQRLENILRSLA